MFSIAVINTRTKHNLKRKTQSIVEESQCRTQPGVKIIEAESPEECGSYFVPYGSFSFMFDTTQDHLPRDCTAHSELGLLSSITNQENVPQACPQANLMENEVALPR